MSAPTRPMAADVAARHLRDFVDRAGGSLLGRSLWAVLADRLRLINIEMAAQDFVDAYSDHAVGDGDAEHVAKTFELLCRALRRRKS